MNPQSRYSAWRYPAFWPRRAIIGFLSFSFLLSVIPPALQYKRNTELSLITEQKFSFGESILTAKLAAVPSFVWLQKLACKLQPRAGCVPAKLYFSEKKMLASDLAFNVEKECKICHSNSKPIAIFRFEQVKDLGPLSNNMVIYSSVSLFLLPLAAFFGIKLFSKSTNLVYCCLFHQSITAKKTWRKRGRLLRKFLKPIYMEEHSNYIRVVTTKRFLTDISEQGILKDWMINDFKDLSDRRIVFTEEQSVKGFPISPESLKNIGSLSVQAKPGYVIIEQSLIQPTKETVMNLQGREALWKGKRGKSKRFLIYPINAINEKKEIT